jgi:hypothetical protein
MTNPCARSQAPKLRISRRRQSDANVQKIKQLHAFAEYLDLSVRRKHEAQVPAAKSRLAVHPIAAGWEPEALFDCMAAPIPGRRRAQPSARSCRRARWCAICRRCDESCELKSVRSNKEAHPPVVGATSDRHPDTIRTTRRPSRFACLRTNSGR